MANDRKLPVGWYLVAFVDVLGQRHLLRQMRGLPDETDQKQMAEFIALLKKTAGAVKSLRDIFHSFFEGWDNRHLDLNELTPHQKNLFLQFKGNPLKSHMFSDSVILFLSLRDDVNKGPMDGVYAILASAASTFLMMLYGGHVVRGGIDIGVGIELRDGELYGAALSRAYELESKAAQYPRIVLGDDLIKYIQFHRSKSDGDFFVLANKKAAELSARLIAIDNDGLPFLDYLGKGFKQDIAKDHLNPDIVEKAYDFVMNESAKCQNAMDSKLAFRYTLLRNYFEHRMHLWGSEA